MRRCGTRSRPKTQRTDPDRLDRQRRIADPAGNRPSWRRPPPDPASTAPIPHLVHRLPDPRTAHPRRHRRRLVARDQRVRPDRHHQRPHRGLQPTGQTGQTCRLRIPEIESTRPAGYDSTAPANSGPQPRPQADCPVKIEEPLFDCRWSGSGRRGRPDYCAYEASCSQRARQSRSSSCLSWCSWTDGELRCIAGWGRVKKSPLPWAET